MRLEFQQTLPLQVKAANVSYGSDTTEEGFN